MIRTRYSRYLLQFPHNMRHIVSDNAAPIACDKNDIFVPALVNKKIEKHLPSAVIRCMRISRIDVDNIGFQLQALSGYDNMDLVGSQLGIAVVR